MQPELRNHSELFLIPFVTIVDDLSVISVDALRRPTATAKKIFIVSIKRTEFPTLIISTVSDLLVVG